MRAARPAIAGLAVARLTFSLIGAAMAAGSVDEAAAAGLIGARVANAAVTAGTLDDRAGGAELSLKLTQGVEVKAFTLANPDRVILDMPQLAFQIDAASLDPGRSDPSSPTKHGSGARRGGHARPAPPALVASVRFGLLAPGRSRVVIGLAAPARIVSTGVARDAAGTAVLTLKLATTDRATFEASARAPQPVASAGPSAVPAAAAPGARPVIVIDPGHGGPDTGAERGGLVEKDLTLAFARSLAARLESDGRYAVVMTRAADVFIPLSERVAIARRSGAALMISVHADTLPEASRDAAEVSGATVYTVSERASDSDAATVAAKENAADAAAGVAAAGDAADVQDILFDLTRQETRAYSHVFARTLVNYWKVVGRLNKNPQRSAGFVVLKAPDIPSVLVELGYLSSPADAAAFQSEEWREKVTGRMAEAVDTYFAEQHAPPRQRSAGLVTPVDAAPVPDAPK